MSTPIALKHLSTDSAWLFPEYDFAQINLLQYHRIIIERILERGSWEQLRWLSRTFGEVAVAEWVRKHGFRLLSNRSFALWRLALNVDDLQAPDWAFTAKMSTS